MNEFERPKPPKPEFPKPELAKSAVPKRAPPKLPIDRPLENDENDENREIAGVRDENRFDVNPQREESLPAAYSPLALATENPETFFTRSSFLEFPNECHWPPDRTLFP